MVKEGEDGSGFQKKPESVGLDLLEVNGISLRLSIQPIAHREGEQNCGVLGRSLQGPHHTPAIVVMFTSWIFLLFVCLGERAFSQWIR